MLLSAMSAASLLAVVYCSYDVGGPFGVKHSIDEPWHRPHVLPVASSVHIWPVK
jgi:hypothetical protein